ncbi:MAG: signal peptidase I, partial [Halanaerobiales bacterium]
MLDRGDIKEFFQSLLIAGILAIFIITFVAQSFIVDGKSMYPTLNHGERLFVNKFIYRFRPPERFEIIIFTPNGQPDSKFIKRVIGLPGETVFIKDGITYIDGQPLKEEYLYEKMLGDYGPYLVGEDEVFVMGDNRNDSADSRIRSYVGNVKY